MARNTADWIATGPRKHGAPLLLTAELPEAVQGWADALRKAHYPAERNRLRAHVTLIHALPASVEEELIDVLRALSKSAPPQARITGLMKLESGTAIALESESMLTLHAQILRRLHGLLTDQDTRSRRLHITIQNKVPIQAARALQAQLAGQILLTPFRFRGFGLYAWEEGLWRPIRILHFHGTK